MTDIDALAMRLSQMPVVDRPEAIARELRERDAEIARLREEMKGMFKPVRKERAPFVVEPDPAEVSAPPGADVIDPHDLWRDLCEKDDRTSPEEYPDMALITEDELVSLLQQYGDERAREARAAAIEEAARWHDREAERIGKLAAEPRNACNQSKMYEAADEHENHAIFIRALAAKPGSET